MYSDSYSDSISEIKFVLFRLTFWVWIRLKVPNKVLVIKSCTYLICPSNTIPMIPVTFGRLYVLHFPSALTTLFS